MEFPHPAPPALAVPLIGDSFFFLKQFNNVSSGLEAENCYIWKLIYMKSYVALFVCNFSSFFSIRPYAHILSVPVSETMSPYPGQTQYQALQQSQPYTIYPQTTQTYGLPPFGKKYICKDFSVPAVIFLHLIKKQILRLTRCIGEKHIEESTRLA